MNKKIVSLVLVCVVVFGIVVGGTFAWLQDTSDAVINTFTVGNVELTLNETDVDLYGEKDGETRVTENSYKLIPGHTYTKDPIVYVTAGSEPCYVFVKVENQILKEDVE